MNNSTASTILSLLAQRLSIITQVAEDVETGPEMILISQTPSDTGQSTPFGMLREKERYSWQPCNIRATFCEISQPVKQASW